MQRMHTRFGLASILVFLSTAAPAVAAADRLIPGEWEFANTSGRDGYTFKKCLKAGDAAQVNGDSAAARAAMVHDTAGRCAVESFAIVEDTVDYVLVCGAQRIKSTTAYRGDRSEATISVSTDSGTTISSVKGHRLGICKP